MEIILGLLALILMLMILGAAIFAGSVGGVFMGIFYAFKSYFSAINDNITNLFVKTICYIVLIGVIAAPVLGIVAAIVFG